MRRTIAALALLTAVSCGEDIAKRYAKSAAAQKPAGPPPPIAYSDAADARVGATYFTSWDLIGDGSVALKYKMGKARHELRGLPKAEGERMYALDGAPPSVDAKAEENGVKLFTPDGKLHWNVKIAAGGIEVSDNAAGTNAYRIATSGLVTKVFAPDGHTIGAVKFENGHDVIRDGAGKLLESVPAKGIRPVYGVVLIDGVAPAERFSMLMELIDKLGG